MNTYIPVCVFVCVCYNRHQSPDFLLEHTLLLNYKITPFPLAWRVLFPFSASCNAPLGMQSGKIKDSQISASSSYDVSVTGPSSARWVAGVLVVPEVDENFCVQDERLLLQVTINLFIIIVIVMKMIAIVVIFIPSYLLPCMPSALFQNNDPPRLDIVPWTHWAVPSCTNCGRRSK